MQPTANNFLMILTFSSVLVVVVAMGIQPSTGNDLQNTTVFQDVLLGMNKDPFEFMNVSYPKLAMIPWLEIGNCYVADIGSRTINIFNSTIGEVITEYFVCQPEKVST